MVKTMNATKTYFLSVLKSCRCRGFLLAWIIVSAIGIHMRLYPLRHHTSDEVKDKASLLVITQIKQTVQKAVAANFPQLSAVEKELLIQKQFNRILRTEKANVRKSIHELSRKLQEQDPEQSPFYLLASDSFYYYDLTKNILKTGRISDKIKGSKYYNNKMNAPHGYWEPFNLHPYTGALIHRCLSRIKPGIPLMSSVSVTPLIIMCISLLPFIWICRHLQCSLPGTITAALFLVSAPIFLKRSMYGWYDNDPYSILFPLTILSVAFSGFKSIQEQRPWLPPALFCGLSIWLYSLFWHGWVFLEALLFAGGVLYGLYTLFFLKQRSRAKRLFHFFTIVISTSFLGVSLFFGWREFFILFQEGLAALKHFWQPSFSLWPDLYIAVGELKRASLPFLVELCGGYLFCLLAFLGLGSCVWQLITKKTDFPGENIFLILFVGVIVPMTLGAQRFALLCIVPASLLAAVGIKQALCFIRQACLRLPRTALPVQAVQTILTSLVLLALACFPVARAYHNTESLLNPIFNATWDQALTRVKNGTPADSIINTWWPPGHFIKAIAERRVTFDGATINQPQAYWLANILLAEDEDTALGLLRMLNNSSNEATDYLLSTGMKLSEAVATLHEISKLDKDRARDDLKDKLNEVQQTHLLNLTHSRPPPSYLLIYNELIEAHILISFTGRWDFQEAENINEDPARMKKVPRAGSKEYISFLWGIAGGYPRYSGILSPVHSEENKVLFSDNVLCQTDTKECLINSPTYGKGVPKYIHFLDSGKIVEKELPNANLNYSVLLSPTESGYQCALMDHNLARSLLMRLYFFKGAGFRDIKPFLQTKDLTTRTQISVYEVDWNAYLSRTAP